MNIDDALKAATDVLMNAGIVESRREAFSLLSFVLGRDRSFLHAHPEYEISADEIEAYCQVVKRRSNHEPFQYITGRQEFWRLEFAVTPDVLIPRPETEILVGAAIEVLRQRESPRFCEVGIGSGCIAVSILHSVPGAAAVATDISTAALAVAGGNAVKHGVKERLRLLHASVFDQVTGTFDLIVSNPPYVPDAQIAALQAEVSGHEPFAALSGGSSGLDVIAKIVEQSPNLLRPSGVLLMEIGFDQADRVEALFDRGLWQSVEMLPDLQGIPRIVKASLI